MAKAWRGTCVTVAMQATIIRQSIKTSHGPHEKKNEYLGINPSGTFPAPASRGFAHLSTSSFDG